MNKYTFRGLIAGMLIMWLLLTGIPVSADTGGSTLSDKLITAITGNNANTRLVNLETQLSNINTKLNNINTSIGNISGSSSNAGNAMIVELYTNSNNSAGGYPNLPSGWSYTYLGRSVMTDNAFNYVYLIYKD